MQNLAQELEPPVPEEEVAAGEPAKTEEPPKAEEPEASPEDGEVEPPKRPDKFVKIQALDEQKHKRRAAEAERDAALKRAAILEDRWNQFLTSQRQPPQQLPPKDTQPIEHFDARINQTQQTVEQLAQYAQQMQVREAQQRQVEQFKYQVASSEAEFTQENPDYPQALEFVRNRRIAELEAAGYEPMQISEMVMRDASAIAWDAMQRGKSPAEVIYNMAVNTGFTKTDPLAAGKQKIDATNRGIQASKSLKNSGGADGWPTAAQIADMSESDFSDLKAKLAKKGLRLSDIAG